MRDISKLEQLLIIATLVDQPKRPGRFSLGWFQQQIDIADYSDGDVRTAINKMCHEGILACDDNAFILERPQYLELKKRLRWPVRIKSAIRKLCSLWGFLWRHFIITILVSVLTAVLTVLTLKWLGMKP